MSHNHESLYRCFISVEIKFPGTFNRLRKDIEIGRSTFEESFAPLPRDRELPWEPRSAERARKMIEWRRRLTRDIGLRIAEELIALVQSKDPVNGFSPEEWASMQEAFARDPYELPKP